MSQDLTNQETLAVEFYHKEELKNLIIQTLVDFNEDYFNNDTRCVIVCALTCYIYDEILSQRWNLRRLNDAIKRIFKDLDFKEVKFQTIFFLFAGIFIFNFQLFSNSTLC